MNCCDSNVAGHIVTGNIYPSPENAYFLKEKCDRKMLSSTKYLVEVVEKGIFVDGSKIKGTIDSCLSLDWNKEKIVSSLYHIQHTRLKYAVENQNVDAAKSAIETLRETTVFSSGLTHGPLHGHEWSTVHNQCIEESLNNSSIKTYGKTMGIEVPSPQLTIRMRSAVSKALEVLSTVDSVLYDETKVLLTDIVYFSSTQTTSGSSFNCLGLVSMNSINETQNWTTALEMIIHEAAHQLVYNLMMSDQMILNEGEGSYRSALRKDFRPMSGIFHALVVLARIIHVMSKLEDSGILFKEGLKIVPPRNNARNTDPYHSKFADLLEVVESNAKLSNIGWEVVESCKALSNRKLSSESFNP